MMDAATPERTHPQRIGDERLKKSLPAVPFERPKAGVHRQAIFWFWFEHDEFMPFLQSQKNILYPLPPVSDTHVTGSVRRSMTIIVSIRGIFDIFQTIGIGSFSLKGHERVFTI